MNRTEETDPVWNLLEKGSPSPDISPFFARNIIREIRKESLASGSLGLVGWLRSPGLIAVATILLLTLVTLFLFRPEGKVESPTAPGVVLNGADLDAFDPTSEMEAVEYLGQLMAIADPAQLTDEALADLFF